MKVIAMLTPLIMLSPLVALVAYCHSAFRFDGVDTCLS